MKRKGKIQDALLMALIRTSKPCDLQHPVRCDSKRNCDQRTHAPRQRGGSIAVDLTTLAWNSRAALSRCFAVGLRLASARAAAESRGCPAFRLTTGCKLSGAHTAHKQTHRNSVRQTRPTKPLNKMPLVEMTDLDRPSSNG